MAIYVWDTSHFDGPIDRDRMARAKAEGIACVTAKIAEGLSDTEGTRDDTTLAAARDAGIEFLGGYGIPRSNVAVADQVAYLVRLADAGEPWWRDFPGWFWQVDLERWGYDNVSAATGVEYARRLRDATGRWTILYASHGQYGDQLAGWDGPLWNADYVSSPAGPATAMYPGDSWQPLHGTWRGGWAPYSGKAPTFLQFTSSATIAGLTTCDASAFRGTLDQLSALVGAGRNGATMTSPLTPAQEGQLANADAWAWAIANLLDTVVTDAGDNPAAPGQTRVPLTAFLKALAAQAQSNGAGISELKTALGAMTQIDYDLLAQKVAALILPAASAANAAAVVDELARRINNG